jgi:hypothetical protein
MKSSRTASFRAALLLLSFCAVIGISHSWGQVYVFNTATLSTGNNPMATASGDFNADGRLDLAIANFNDNTVSVIISNPDGSFQPKVDYPVGTAPIAMLAADLNKDGKLDLAVVNNNCPSIPCTAVGSISTLLGNGDGTFQSHVDKSVGNSPNALATADFNRDGKADMAVTNGQDNTISVLIGKGDGTFNLVQSLITGVNPHGIVVADFDGDGLQDLVIANQTDSNVGLYKGTANGFHTPNTFATGLNPSALVVADVNGDGKPDVITANSGAASVSIMIDSFTGGFADHVDFNTLDKVTAITAGDFNGDGIVDMATTATASNAISVLWGKGDGSFFLRADFASGSSPVALSAGDFTGDGRTDLAIANSLDNTVHILPGLGVLALQNRTVIPTGNQPNGIATCDFNQDGNMDMAIADRSDNALLILQGNGNGTFTVLPNSPATGVKPSSVIAVDLNKDNHCDLVATNASDGTVSVFLGNGDGTFGGASLLTVSKRPVSAVAADFNKDGNLDLAVVNQNDLTVSILLGNGNGTFQLQKKFFTGAGTNPSWIAAADFGNGKIDLAVSDSATGAVSVLLGAGDGTFSNPVAYPTGATPSSVAIGDFNGDGKLDLAVTNNVGNTVSILLGNGNGLFQSHVDFPTAKGPFYVTAVDLNSDGKLDLAIGASGSGSNRVSILLGNGDGTFQPHVDHSTAFLVGGLSEQLAVADFNNDGAPDIAAADQFANSVSLFMNSAVPTLFPASLDFGAHNLGVPSSPITSTLANVGTAPLNNLAPPVVSPADYSMASDCGSGLAMGASCATQVTFTATDVGARNGTLTYTDSAPSNPQVSVLTATGNGAGAALSATSLTFPVTIVNTTSPKQTVQLTNYGNQTLTLTITPPAASFLENNTCGLSLAAGKTCTITVAFRPKSSGTLTGTITITDNAPNSPQTISLTGTGTIVKLTPTSLGFGNQQVGTTSAPRDITLSNVGNRTLNAIVITIVGTNAPDFAISSTTCTSTLAKGASCTISVTFTPTAIGLRTGNVSVADDGGGSPQTVALSGTGTP